MLKFLKDLLFPKFCLGCGREDSYLCEDCKHILDISEYNFCLCENYPQRLPPHSEKGKCEKCRNKVLDGLYFALSYKENNLTKKLIRQFKYSPYLKDLSETLAGILAEHFIKTEKNKNEIWENSVLIPVPIHAKKLRERGYNQSEELAKKLSEIIKIPVLINVLIKIKKTESQMSLNKFEREENLKGAFLVKNAEKIKGRKIFLVDDVYTTGSTMQECALALRRSGAKSVWGIAIAREG